MVFSWTATRVVRQGYFREWHDGPDDAYFLPRGSKSESRLVECAGHSVAMRNGSEFCQFGVSSHHLGGGGSPLPFSLTLVLVTRTCGRRCCWKHEEYRYLFGSDKYAIGTKMWSQCRGIYIRRFIECSSWRRNAPDGQIEKWVGATLRRPHLTFVCVSGSLLARKLPTIFLKRERFMKSVLLF